jgi:hypothetical protein
LREGARVVRPGGVVLVAGISCFASLYGGLFEKNQALLADDLFAAMVEEDLSDGTHRNPTCVPGWFTTSYFHRPDELDAEMAEAGLAVE